MARYHQSTYYGHSAKGIVESPVRRASYRVQCLLILFLHEGADLRCGRELLTYLRCFLSDTCTHTRPHIPASAAKSPPLPKLPAPRRVTGWKAFRSFTSGTNFNEAMACHRVISHNGGSVTDIVPEVPGSGPLRCQSQLNLPISSHRGKHRLPLLWATFDATLLIFLRDAWKQKVTEQISKVHDKYCDSSLIGPASSAIYAPLLIDMVSEYPLDFLWGRNCW